MGWGPRTALAACVALSVACSLSIPSLPRDHVMGAEPDCVSSSARPAADVIAGAVLALLGTVVLSAGIEQTGCESNQHLGPGAEVCVAGGLGIAVGVALWGAALHGRAKLRRCARAERAFRDARDER